MISSNPTHSSSLGKVYSELKSLLQEAGAVFSCFFVMLVLTGGKPPDWIISSTFLLTSGLVFLAEIKRELFFSQQLNPKDIPPPLRPTELKTPFSEPSQDVPIHFLYKGRVKDWNAWVDANVERANLREANLRYSALSGANLSGANLSYANLERAFLKGANLSAANLERAFLREANLNEANLSGTNLEGANLSHANLRGTNLEGAILSHANLSRTNLEGAILKDANVKNVLFGKGIGLTNSEKRDLIQRGAIFDDSTGDRNFVLRE